MLIMFGTSAAFHRLRWSAPAWRRMRRADHSAIFVGIAGTSTAVAGLALTGWARVLVLAMVWGGAAAGIVLRQVWLDAPQWVVAIPYVVVGWCPVIVAPQLVRSLGWAGFGLMLAGGLAYTAGALVYARKRPDPWPDVFGFHEVFHACTLVGAGLFAYLVAFIALPRVLSGAAPQAMTPSARSRASSSGPSPSSAASTASVCSPSHGTRVSGPSATSANFTGSPGISTGWSTPSVRGCSTSMWRPARWGSATTSASVATGPATRPAAFSASHASRLVLVVAQDSTAGRMSLVEVVEPALRRGEARVVGPLGALDRPRPGPATGAAAAPAA